MVEAGQHVDMTDPDLHALLGRVFFPYNQARTEQAIAAGGRFVYYTTADTARKIIRSRQVWLRNAAVMNDFSEISHGLACLDQARVGLPGRTLQQAIDMHFPNLYSEVETAFAEMRPVLHLDTYLMCVSEHRSHEDERGRLSMWRAYGGRNGVAMVINGGAMFSTSNAIGAFSSPVFYGDPAAFADEFQRAAQGIADAIDALVHLGRDVVRNALVQMLRFAALSTKHPGFQEELEWRVIASPALYDTPRLVKEIEVVNGVPQRVVKIALENAPAHGLHGLDLPELIERIIVGPCDFPLQTGQAFLEELSIAGVPNPQDRVVVSDIPLRHNA